MSCSFTSEDGIVTLNLAAVLDNMVAEELLDVCREALHSDPKEINISAGSVDRVSTPCVQVIMSAIRTAADQKVPVHLNEASPALQAAFEDLGLKAELYALNEGLG